MTFKKIEWCITVCKNIHSSHWGTRLSSPGRWQQQCFRLQTSQLLPSERPAPLSSQPLTNDETQHVFKHRHSPFSTETHHSKSEIQYLFGNTRQNGKLSEAIVCDNVSATHYMLLDLILLNKINMWRYYYDKINWLRLDYIDKWLFVINTVINLTIIKPCS